MVDYTYDEWGKVISITGSMADFIGKLNPMRYRSYYFDNKTDYYYLQSRYYDCGIGRFINADEAGILALTKGEAVGHNLFAYCGNDPINNVDFNGYIKINIKWVATAVDLTIWLIPALFAISKIWSSVSRSAGQLVSFGKKLIVSGKKLFRKLDDRLYCAFARENTYRFMKTIGILAGVVTVISSIGNIVQYIIDNLDGKWDGFLNTNNLKPKINFTKCY